MGKLSVWLVRKHKLQFCTLEWDENLIYKAICWGLLHGRRKAEGDETLSGCLVLLRRWLVPPVPGCQPLALSHRDRAASSELCWAELAVPEWGKVSEVRKGSWRGDSATSAPCECSQNLEALHTAPELCGMSSPAASENQGPAQGGATSFTKSLSYLLRAGCLFLPQQSFPRAGLKATSPNRYFSWKHTSTTTAPKSDITRVFIPP